MKKFYVYEHWRTDRNECFYVGKGTGSRAFQKKNNRNSHYLRVADKLSASGHEITIVIVRSDMTENEALLFEMERIAFWREKGIELCNMTSGGDGVRSPSPETIEKMKAASRRRWSDPANRKAASEKSKAVMQNPEIRKKCINNLGKKMPKEVGEKISAALKGKPRPHVSERFSGEKNPFYRKKHSAETIAKIAQKKTGQKMTEETKSKMRASQRRRREREAGLI